MCFTGISFFINGDRTIWFFILLILLYIIYPFLFKLEKKFGVKIFLILIFLVTIFNLFLSNLDPILFNNIEIVTRRIPIFLLGCFFLNMLRKGLKLKKNLLF